MSQAKELASILNAVLNPKPVHCNSLDTKYHVSYDSDSVTVKVTSLWIGEVLDVIAIMQVANPMGSAANVLVDRCDTGYRLVMYV